MNHTHSDTYFIETHFQTRPIANEFAPEAIVPPPGASFYAPASQKSRNASADWEQTQQIVWTLPDEPRLRVVRGGLRRDWRSGLPMVAGMGFICLLIAGLAHWPYHAQTVASSSLPVRAAPSASSPYITAAPQAVTPTQYYTPYGAAPLSGGYYRRIARPVPGYGNLYVPPARPGMVTQVPPAAPTASVAGAFHYSY